MAAKECLKDYTAQKREAEDLELRVEELRQKRLRVKSYDTSGISRRTRRDIADTVATIDELISRYLSKIAEQADREKEIDETIEKIDDPIEREILILRYIRDKNQKTGKPYTWREIGDRVGYSERNAQYKHGDALISFEAAAEKKSLRSVADTIVL